MTVLDRRGVGFGAIHLLIDGEPATVAAQGGARERQWVLPDGMIVGLRIERAADAERLSLRIERGARALRSLGLRFSAVTGVARYLRNGYQSWDGSFFVAPGTPTGEGPPARAPTLGFAATALLAAGGPGAVILGFERHDRFQTRFRFGGTAGDFFFDAETLLDETDADEGETLVLFDSDDVEDGLRRWSALVAAAAPTRPRASASRIVGWCSWYNLYAAISEENLKDHLAAAAAYRDRTGAPLDVFLIDDGFTPEMGDWLDVKPQFPRGMKALVADIARAGFTPGLWIAPFMVGNRSRLYAAHPDWVVRDRTTGGPLVEMRFYGEFRWHKRSEEYYVLDVTHPEAAAYIADVFRTWRKDWGAGFFKTDFMYFGAEFGPDRARWHEPGLSRIAVWRRMASLIRREIGDAVWLGCGCPLWASVGLVDAIRIGRDIGVSWSGERSAESLLQDQVTRNHADGVLWRSDPDCLLLRARHHELSKEQQRAIALFAGLAGGVLMTSDHFDEVAPDMQALFAWLATRRIRRTSFPDFGGAARAIHQVVEFEDGARATLTLEPKTGRVAWESALVAPPGA